jgi:multimeric flavodoxin WrbA
LKNILFLNCSARNNGNTNKLLSTINSEINRDYLNAQILHLSDYKINYCKGCHSCESTCKCAQDDDVKRIYKELYSTDLICFASPSYWGYVTGQLKVFFDRSTPYCNTILGKSVFPNGKFGISISLRAGSNPDENKVLIDSIEHYYSHLEIRPIGNYTFEKIRKASDLETGDAKIKIKKIVSDLNSWGQNSA